MNRPLSDAEYVACAGARCPYCGSNDLEGQGDLEADGRDCWQEILCRKCQATWRDIYRLVGFEGTEDSSEASHPENEDGKYIVFIEGDVEPWIIGPFANADERDKKARELKREHGDEHGIFMLTVDSGSGMPVISAYSRRFFDEETT